MKTSLSKAKTTVSTNKNKIVVGSSYAEDIIYSKIKRKIENATEGLSPECFNFLHKRVLPTNKENALTICDYISSLRSEINPSDGYTWS